MEAYKKNGVVIKNPNDHWAFLEHIEAPMWVDLTLEAKSGGEHISGDEWFYTSHPFHQLSAQELKSKFSKNGKQMLTSSHDLQGLASPELPSSVSRSRGQHYSRLSSKKWEGANLNILLEKQKGLSRRGFQQGSGFRQEVKPKSKSSVNWPKGLFNAKLGLAVERGDVRGKTKSMASCSNSVSSSSSVDNKTGGSTTRSTITSEKTLQHLKFRDVSSKPSDQRSRSSSVRGASLGISCATKMEVSSQPGDRKSGSSSAISSFRKSYVTGKASKVEMSDDNIQSRGRKSSSGKSSVGSCSNPGYEVKFVTRQQKEKIKDEKGVVTENISVKNQCKPGEISKTSVISVEEAKSSKSKGSDINFAKPAYHRTAKSLVQYQSIHLKALSPGKVNKEKTCTSVKEKVGSSKVNSLIDKGKENATRNMTVNRRCIERGVPAGGMLKNRRTTEHSRLQKSDTLTSTALTILEDPAINLKQRNHNLTRRTYLH